jgi:hypothetical protein
MVKLHLNLQKKKGRTTNKITLKNTSHLDLGVAKDFKIIDFGIFKGEGGEEGRWRTSAKS